MHSKSSAPTGGKLTAVIALLQTKSQHEFAVIVALVNEDFTVVIALVASTRPWLVFVVSRP